MGHERWSHMQVAVALLLTCTLASAADFKPLFNGKSLDGWEVIGYGRWTVL